jgi:hypothetical protein
LQNAIPAVDDFALCNVQRHPANEKRHQINGILSISRHLSHSGADLADHDQHRVGLLDRGKLSDKIKRLAALE